MYPCHRRRFIDRTVLTLGALPPASLLAADAQQAVKARLGDSVLLLNVSTHPAHRPAPQGMALMVDPSPRHEDSPRARQTNSLAQAVAQPGTATPPPSGGGGE